MIVESASYRRRARAVSSWVAVCATLSVVGCSKANGNTTAPAPAAEVPAVKVLPETPEGVLEGYELIRRSLAEDRVAAVSAFAKQLTAAARGVVAGKTSPQLPVFERIASASATLETTDAKDPDAVRRQFGEVSHAVVDLLTENEALRGSRLVFECPMAQGYRNWVQLTPTINNPYMGSKMLECGVASKWAKP